MEILITVNVVIAAVLLLGGGLLRFAAKPDLDAAVGYKTRLASVSAEARGFANRLCGLLWLLVGAAALAVTVLIIFTQPKTGVLAGILIAQITAAVIAVIYTEHRLKKKF